MVNAKLWAKMIGWGGLLCVGGPALVIYVTPTEEELRSRYNPDLKRRSLEGQNERREQFNSFVGQLKEYSKSDKPIWVAQAEDVARKKSLVEAESSRIAAEAQKRRDEIRAEASGAAR